jgi:hypothetical protein
MKKIKKKEKEEEDDDDDEEDEEKKKKKKEEEEFKTLRSFRKSGFGFAFEFEMQLEFWSHDHGRSPFSVRDHYSHCLFSLSFPFSVSPRSCVCHAQKLRVNLIIHLSLFLSI